MYYSINNNELSIADKEENLTAYFDNVKEGFSNSERLLRKEKIYLNDVENLFKQINDGMALAKIWLILYILTQTLLF